MGTTNPLAILATGAILSSLMPDPEATMPSSGVGNAASRNDHIHPRLTSASRVTLDSNGEATVVYTRTFINKPALVLTPVNPTGLPVMLEVTSDTFVGGVYTGCTIKGYRAQLLPLLSGIILIGPLVSALSNFNVFGGNAASVEVSVIALQAS